jgi:hypothetical protein
MPRPPRTRPIGRPSLPYRPVQMNAKVHPIVKRHFTAAAKARGISIGALLLELISEEAGIAVEDFLALPDTEIPGSELPMTG